MGSERGHPNQKRSLHALSQFRSLKISFEQIRQKRKEEKQSQKQADEAARKAQIEYDIKNKDFGGPLIIYPKGRSYHPGHSGQCTLKKCIEDHVRFAALFGKRRKAAAKATTTASSSAQGTPESLAHSAYSYQYPVCLVDNASHQKKIETPRWLREMAWSTVVEIIVRSTVVKIMLTVVNSMAGHGELKVASRTHDG